MRLHRFIGGFDLTQDTLEILDREKIKQIKDVLRLKKGDRLILGDGRGKISISTIKNIGPKSILVHLKKSEKNTGENWPKISLYLAILKKENFELAVQKAVESGISRIVPVLTERTIKTGINTARLEKIIIEASEQSGRSVVPVLSPIMDFKNALRDTPAEEQIIFQLNSELYSPLKNIDTGNILIGPEGGFTENEISLAKGAGWKAASLGPLTLRGETAAIIASYRSVNRI